MAMIVTQPFRSGDTYASASWNGLTFQYNPEQNHILMKSPSVLQTVSSAPFGGGSVSADHIVNVYVSKSYDCSDPVGHLRGDIGRWGYPPDTTIGLLTAAKLTHAAIAEAEGDQAAIVCCTTAGTSNGARAGRERETFAAYEAGTINTIVAIDGRMTAAAMIGAIITATEAKTAALCDLGIVDALYGEQATGTTTDTVVIAVSQSSRYAAEHRYAGCATTLGNLLGRLVYQSVYRAVQTQGDL